MPGVAVIANAAQFKEPVQIFAVLFIQLAGFDQEFMNGGNDAAVFLVFPAFAQQGRGGGIKGGLISPGRSKIPMPGFIEQLGRPDRFFRPLQVGRNFRLEERQAHSCIPSRRAWR